MYCVDERKRIPVDVVCSSYNFKIRVLINGKPHIATYEELWKMSLDNINTIHLYEKTESAIANDPFMSIGSSFTVFISEKEDIEGFAEFVLGKALFEVRSIILAEEPNIKLEEDKVALSSMHYYYEVSFRNNRLTIRAKDKEGYYEVTIKTHSFNFTKDYKELFRNVEKFGSTTRIVF